jgi:hypothetical protein
MKVHVKISVDEDVVRKYRITDTSAIVFLILVYLNDPSGWGHHGYWFEQVEHGQKVHIRLSSDETVTSECGLKGKLSCAILGGNKMWLNAERWFHGAAKSKLSLDDYRQYMVSHEMGHILGHEHTKCPCKGCKAPIMMQQTLGIGQCKPNTSV